MRLTSQSRDLFSGQAMHEFQEERLNNLRAAVNRMPSNQLLNANETDLVTHLVSEHSLEDFAVDVDAVTITSEERMIPAERFDMVRFGVERGEKYAKQVIVYHIPFRGPREYLTLRPTTRLIWSCETRVEGQRICFEIINFNDDAEQIKGEATHTLANIKQQAANVCRDLKHFNETLETHVRKAVQDRKAEHLKRTGLMASLGVPIQKAASVPDSFAIPVKKKAPIVKMPTVPTGAFVPEPALDASTYGEILRICRDTGVEMERHPDIYREKGEETLRDHFIMVLSPHFQSVTGETFNRTGKTDILIRHEKANVFVAECKFWSGAKGYFAAIDQLLGYLTWRDSKAALLSFVPNTELKPVLEQLRTKTSEHPCFVRALKHTDEAWLNFEFRLPKDPTRSVQLAVLAFHFPD